MNQLVRESCRSIFVNIATFFSRYGLTYQDLEEILKEAVVEAALKEAESSGEKLSNRLVAERIGLSRRAVAQVVSERDRNRTPLQTEKSVPGGVLLKAWHNDPQFLDESGRPCILPLASESGEVDFSILVSHSGDSREPSVVLAELLCNGSVELVDANSVKVIARTLIMDRSEEAVVRYFGIAASNLLSTLVHNTHPDRESPAYFERTTWVSGINNSTFLRFSDLVSETSIPFLELLDDWLTSRKNKDEAISDEDGVIGVGIYVFDRGSKT